MYSYVLARLCVLVIFSVLSYAAWKPLAKSDRVRDWNERDTHFANLSLLPDRQFPFHNFNPYLFRRADGSDFVLVALVDDPAWISLALNSFVSWKRFRSHLPITILTVNNPIISAVFRKLGFYVYDAGNLVATFPPEFAPAKTLQWSWNEVIFLRFNLWNEAFKRNIGFCSLDIDITYNRDVFFGVKSDGTYADISMQGTPLPPIKKYKKTCKYQYIEQTRTKYGYYLNPGYSCHAANQRTIPFMESLQTFFRKSIDDKLKGWGQVAYMKGICEAGFSFLGSTRVENLKWKGTVAQHDIKVSIFKAMNGTETISAEQRKHVPAYHIKGCHTEDRVSCKENILKAAGQWFLPRNLPRDLQGWQNLSESSVVEIKKLLL